MSKNWKGTNMAKNTNESWDNQQKTYNNFMGLAKWTCIGLAVLLVFLYVVINP